MPPGYPPLVVFIQLVGYPSRGTLWITLLNMLPLCVIIISLFPKKKRKKKKETVTDISLTKLVPWIAVWKTLEAWDIMIRKNVLKNKRSPSGILGDCSLEIQSCFWSQLLLLLTFSFLSQGVIKTREEQEPSSSFTIRNNLHSNSLPYRSVTHY